jgi:hypothetical protein
MTSKIVAADIVDPAYAAQIQAQQQAQAHAQQMQMAQAQHAQQEQQVSVSSDFSSRADLRSSSNTT